MGILFLILFVLAETALVVLTFTKFTEKVKWLKNRLIIRAAETVLLLGMILVPSTHLKWRFFGAVIILVVRLIISGIAYLVKHKKISGIKKKARTVVNCVFSILLITVFLIPAFLFTNYNGLPTTGKYDVIQSDAILVDESRLDEFENDGSYREVPAHFFYPESDDDTFPLIVFSHGAFGYYQSNYSTYEELASHGYVVVSLDHPHHAFFTKDTEGQTVIVDTDFINLAMEINDENTSNEEIFTVTKEWMKLRTDDENFVLDTIKEAKQHQKLNKAWHTDDEKTILNVLSKTDTDKIGLMGHSLGGASSVALGRERDDIDAVVDLDGTMLGDIVGVKNGDFEYEKEVYPVPVLDFTKESDYNEREQFKNENGYAYVNENVIQNAKDGKTIVFANTGHMDFTDLPLISPTLASMLGKGEVNSEEFLPMMNGIVLEWFDYYLKNEGTLDIQARY